MPDIMWLNKVSVQMSNHQVEVFWVCEMNAAPHTKFWFGLVWIYGTL